MAYGVPMTALTEWLTNADDCAASERKDVPAFIKATIGPLIDYDADKGTDLIRTVEAYFAAGRNVTKTKDALHGHGDSGSTYRGRAQTATLKRSL